MVRSSNRKTGESSSPLREREVMGPDRIAYIGLDPGTKHIYVHSE